MLHEIKIEHPPVERSPHFLGRIDPEDLVPGARHYNPSLSQHGGKYLMAYRVESYTAVSKVAILRLDADLQPVEHGDAGGLVGLPLEQGDEHWEDPHLASVGGKLYLMALYIRLVIPPVCRPRLFVIDPVTLCVESEVPMTFGKLGGIEKNWTPFENAQGGLSFVYRQTPTRMIVDVETMAGHETPTPPIAPTGSSLSGRAGPVRHGGHLFEFVGGWVRIPTRYGRYWFGCLMLDPTPPYRVIAYTPVPIMWGTEASPTIHSPRPNAGHPCCLFPAGAVAAGPDLVVSVGVNDSYCTLMRFNVQDLVGKMKSFG